MPRRAGRGRCDTLCCSSVATMPKRVSREIHVHTEKERSGEVERAMSEQWSLQSRRGWGDGGDWLGWLRWVVDRPLG